MLFDGAEPDFAAVEQIFFIFGNFGRKGRFSERNHGCLEVCLLLKPHFGQDVLIHFLCLARKGVGHRMQIAAHETC